MNTDGMHEPQSDGPVIVWFRRDLRLGDNPALAHAAQSGRPIVPLYIRDERLEGRPLGGAALWWLDGSLRALSADLMKRGAPLVLRRGDAEAELHRLIAETGATALVMNRLFEPEASNRDRDIAHSLKADGADCLAFNGTLLTTPGQLCTGAGGPYKVFTPFRKALAGAPLPDLPGDPPDQLSGVSGLDSEALDDWSLRPTTPDWATGFDWSPGEAAAQNALDAFVRQALSRYSIGRDQPAEAGGSRLSPHLHWGELHPARVISAIREAAKANAVPPEEAAKYESEIAWREFSAHLLYHFPAMTERAFKPQFDALPWREDEAAFRAWSRGRTGYPIVDAGMRQLWATGWMHNRVRMIVASFLIKDLLIDWRRGEAWFWDTLVDADLGNNVQNWQWIAGSGADASPFFRIFNPTTQGERFDRKGGYVRRWVPELAGLPDKWLHAPWTAPADVLANAGVRLGETYPRPIVDHGQARDRALAALRTIARVRADDDLHGSADYP